MTPFELRHAIAMRLDGMSIEGIAAELGQARATVQAALDAADPRDVWHVMDAVCALEPEPWPEALCGSVRRGDEPAAARPPVIGARRYRVVPLTAPGMAVSGPVALGEPPAGRSALDQPREPEAPPSVAVGRRGRGQTNMHAATLDLMIARRQARARGAA